MKIDVINLCRKSCLSVPCVEKVIRAVLKKEKIKTPRVTLLLAGDPYIRRLNKRFLGKDAPTDVLSFDAGDIAISIDAARRRSKALGVDLREEAARYIIHGLLHLCGYDDNTTKKSKRMWRRQEELLKKMVNKVH